MSNNENEHALVLHTSFSYDGMQCKWLMSWNWTYARLETRLKRYADTWYAMNKMRSTVVETRLTWYEWHEIKFNAITSLSSDKLLTQPPSESRLKSSLKQETKKKQWRDGILEECNFLILGLRPTFSFDSETYPLIWRWDIPSHLAPETNLLICGLRHTFSFSY